jgi:hypothetical protein
LEGTCYEREKKEDLERRSQINEAVVVLAKSLRNQPRRALFLGIAWAALVTACGVVAFPHLLAQDKKNPPIGIPVSFTDIREAAGITFQEDPTATPDKQYIETMGTGLGWIDYNGDGLLDIYFVQTAETEWYEPPQPLRSALYRNNGDGTFTDVTEKAGVGGEGLYGQGVAVGDYDNNGYPDLYLMGYGRAILYRNKGDGTFTNVTKTAGVEDLGQWPVSAGWFDYDKDGHLDLLVCNYIQWSPANNLWCGEKRPGYRAYCHPDNYKGQKLVLYHNKGDGTFEDVSAKSGVGEPEAKGMGTVLADFNQPTSTWIPGPTSLWPTTPGRTSCFSTTTTALSATSLSVPVWRPAKTASTKRVWVPTPPTWTGTAGSIST